MVLGWDTWLYLEEDSLRRQLLIWIESVAYGHCPELGPQTLRGGGQGRGICIEVFLQIEEEGQGLNLGDPCGVGVTETHTTWSDFTGQGSHFSTL